MKKRISAVLGVGLAASAVLTACGGGSPGAQSSGSGTSQDPLKVSIMTSLSVPTPAADNNPIKLAIEKATNSKLDIQWVSLNNYTDKLNVTLASGDIPDLIMIDNPFSSVFRSMVTQGAFWDIGPYIKDYPNLSGLISKSAWELSKMQDGKNYGIPRPRPAEGDDFFIIRKDWLDNLGLKVPTTTDELYTVMKAFTENDPDKDGKQDTTGFAAYVNPTDMGHLAAIEKAFTGANGVWKVVDGSVVNTAFLPEQRQALEYMNKLYKEKLIPQDFASIKLSQIKEMFQGSKAGIIVGKAGAMQDYIPKIKAAQPSVKESDYYPITNINGFNPKGPGFLGILAIPKKVPEDKMKRILKLVDTWMSKDVFAYQQYGIEGVDYTVKDGVKVLDHEKLIEDHGPDFNQIVYVADPYGSSTKEFFPKELNDLYSKIQDERAKTSVADISTGLYSQTALQFLPEFQKNLQDLKTKIILGHEPITAWDTYINKMKNDPNVIKMSKEMTESYQKRMSGK